MAECKYPSEQREKDAMAYRKIAQDFQSKPVIEQFGSHSADMFNRLVHQVTNGESRVPYTEELKLLKRLTDRTVKNVGTTRGKFAEYMYLPQELYKDIPFVADWFKDVQKSNEFMKGQTSMSNEGLNRILRLLKGDALIEGAKVSDKVKFTKAQKELKKLYGEYNKLRREGKDGEADRLYHGEIAEFMKQGEGKVLQQFHELASAPKERTANDSRKTYDELLKTGQYSNNVKAAAEVWRNQLQPESTRLMIQGINNMLYGLKNNNPIMKDLPGFNETIQKLESVRDRFKDADLQRNGYFPVLSLDIFPSLSKAAQKLALASKPKQVKEATDIIDNLEKVLNENIYINRNLTDSTPMHERINYNVFPIMQSYANNAIRFNYNAFNTRKYMDVMKDIMETQLRGDNKQVEAKLNFLKNYVSDSYSDIVGTRFENPTMGTQLSRMITSLEFASKLGLNIRGAVRNSTQSLFNYIWFGGNGIKQAREIYKDTDMMARINEGLKNNGVLFPEITDIYGSMKFTRTEYNERTKTYEEVIDVSMGDRIGDQIQKTAELLGKPMTWVENNINRRWTFKIGYALSWKAIESNLQMYQNRFERVLQRDLKREGRKETVEELRNSKDRNRKIFKEGDATEYEFRFEEYKRKVAEAEGNAATRNLHFDYSPLAKAKIMRGPIGAILTQFQHYGFNFFNLQRKIVRDGTDAVFTKQWNSEPAWRMYRLGLTYLAINGVMAPLLNMDLGNLVQNDTWERIKSYHDVVAGDEETRKRAFFGKGPIIGTFGGPFVSDAVSIGNIMGFYNMDEDSALAFMAGYQDMSELSGNEKMSEAVKVLNTQTHRLFTNTIPKWSKGINSFTLLQGELGLYPRSETRKKQIVQPAVQKLYGSDKEEPKKVQRYDYNKAVMEALDKL